MRLARLNPNGGRSSRLRDLSGQSQHRRAVLRILPVHLRVLLSKRWRLQLGIVDTEPVAREEVGSRSVDQLALSTWKHLESLLFPSTGRDSLSVSNAFDDGIRMLEHRNLHVDEVVVEKGEQEDSARLRKHRRASDALYHMRVAERCLCNSRP